MKLPDYHPFRSAEAKEQYLALNDRRAQAWPIPSETRMVETPYGQTFVRISGPADAAPLVLLPGIAISSLMWGFSIGALSAGYRTYAVDHIDDVGRSVCTRPVQGSADLTSWLDSLFTALALGNKINLMGMSFGGWQVSQYALRFPNRLAKAVLLAPAATVLPVRLVWILRGLLSGLHRYLRKSFMYWMMQDCVRRDEAGKRFVEEMMDDAEVASRCFKRRRVIFPTVLSDEDLRSLTVPTLYVVGDNETLYSPKRALDRLNRIAPQIKTELVPGAGHDLLLVQKERIERTVLGFLAEP